MKEDEINLNEKQYWNPSAIIISKYLDDKSLLMFNSTNKTIKNTMDKCVPLNKYLNSIRKRVERSKEIISTENQLQKLENFKNVMWMPKDGDKYLYINENNKSCYEKTKTHLIRTGSVLFRAACIFGVGTALTYSIKRLVHLGDVTSESEDEFIGKILLYCLTSALSMIVTSELLEKATNRCKSSILQRQVNIEHQMDDSDENAEELISLDEEYKKFNINY